MPAIRPTILRSVQQRATATEPGTRSMVIVVCGFGRVAECRRLGCSELSSAVSHARSLGRFPDMGFEQARERWPGLNGAGGANPIEANRARKSRSAMRRKSSRTPTFDARPSQKLAMRYLGVFVSESRGRSVRSGTCAEERRLLRQAYQAAARRHEARGHPHSRHRRNARRDHVHQRTTQGRGGCPRPLSHAKSDGLIEANPALGVKAPDPASRTRVLSDDELRTLWNGLSAPIEVSVRQCSTRSAYSSNRSAHWRDPRDAIGATSTAKPRPGSCRQRSPRTDERTLYRSRRSLIPSSLAGTWKALRLPGPSRLADVVLFLRATGRAHSALPAHGRLHVARFRRTASTRLAGLGCSHMSSRRS